MIVDYLRSRNEIFWFALFVNVALTGALAVTISESQSVIYTACGLVLSFVNGAIFVRGLPHMHKTVLRCRACDFTTPFKGFVITAAVMTEHVRTCHDRAARNPLDGLS